MGLDIAIVGSGIAGLSAAWYLGNRHRITMFEKANALGMGHKGKEVDTKLGKIWMDIPPRVTNKDHYSALFELLEEADIDTYVIKQQASFNMLGGDTYLAFDTINSKRTSISFPKPNLTSARWLKQHAKDLVRFYHSLWIKAPKPELNQKALGTYLQEKGYHSDFIYGFLYPMWGLMCTCSYDELNRFPANDMINLFKSFTSQAKSRRIAGGTAAFQNKLKNRIHHCYLDDEVKEIQQQGKQIKIRTTKGENLFDHVIVATEPAYAAPMLKGFEKDREAIESVPSINTEMVLHTDKGLMPKRKSQWGPVNLFWDQKGHDSTATLWMNQLEQAEISQDVFQTWNPIVEPASETILARKMFKRTLVTHKSAKAICNLRNMMETDLNRRIWYVGSYTVPGIPLLENGVKSAQLVEDLIEAPRQQKPTEKIRKHGESRKNLSI